MGTSGHEIEFKLGVASDATFHLFLREIGTTLEGWPQVRQVNHFFDTADQELRALGIALRLREEDEQFIITAKGPAPNPAADANVMVKAEEEILVEREVGAAILAHELRPDLVLAEARGASALVQRIAETVGERNLRHVGSFKNTRSRVGPIELAPGHTVIIELDRTELPGDVVQFEIEIEVEPEQVEACAAALEAIRQRLGVEWIEYGSKAKRFFAALE